MNPTPTPSPFPQVVVPPIHVEVVDRGVDPLAVLALAISGGLIAWEIFKFWREGGRVKVKLLAGIWDGSSYASGPRRRTASATLMQRSSHATYTIDVASVRVENWGRTPVTIANIQFHHGPAWPSSKRTSIAYRPIEILNTETKLPIRLEPNDGRTFAFDALEVLQGAWSQKDPPLRIFAAVQLESGRPARSPLRSAWRFSRGSRPWLREPNQWDLEQQIFRYLCGRMRQGHEALSFHYINVTAGLADLVRSGQPVTSDEIKRVLDEHGFDQVGHHMAAFDLVHELSGYASGPIDVHGSAKYVNW